ncbi:phage tail assembly protein [Castellaniella sp.]|uniref:phage tail assembly protein n=1 Tax=Castellaniella sp. TaxID=1955812 RepID=UPI002AFE9ABE|nr:phage tail assembly protein [Castellaniella sp.]
MSDRTIVELKYPVEIDGAQVSVLKLRRPKVRDNLAAEKMGATNADREIALIALLADVAPSALHELDMGDYAALQKAVAGFF